MIAFIAVGIISALVAFHVAVAGDMLGMSALLHRFRQWDLSYKAQQALAWMCALVMGAFILWMIVAVIAAFGAR